MTRYYIGIVEEQFELDETGDSWNVSDGYETEALEAPANE